MEFIRRSCFGVLVSGLFACHAAQKLPTPVIVPGDTVFVGYMYAEITLYDSTSYVVYTQDGSAPTMANGTLTNGQMYTALWKIIIDSNTTLRARSFPSYFDTSHVASDICSVRYLRQLSPPVFNMGRFVAHNFNDSVTITLFALDSARIYYTGDSTVPDTNSTLYSQPIVIRQSMCINAIAVRQGLINSKIATDCYVKINNSKVLKQVYPKSSKDIYNKEKIRVSVNGRTVDRFVTNKDFQRTFCVK